MKTLIPIISMYGPWAHWVELGWKEIETRTHARFASLKGKRIGIHVAKQWDGDATWETARKYMDDKHRGFSLDHRIGAIICTVFVKDARWLADSDSQNALIDCGTVKRFGLFLSDVKRLDNPIYARGKQGIWYHDLTPTDVPAKGHETGGEK